MTNITDSGYYSRLALPIRTQNFTPQLSAILTTGASSTFVSFASGLTGLMSQTFKITNKGSKGAYLGWGNSNDGTVTAVASTATPAANCDYIASGAILTQDFQKAGTIINTIAAVQDSGSTTLEISVGFGQ